MHIHRRRQKKTAINITSLIDVLFLLLIFFMLSSTFKEQPGMKLELPESETAEKSEIKDLILHITLDDKKTVSLRLNNKSIALDNLAASFKEIGGLESQSLTLKADQHVEHGTIVKIMDIAKQNNIKKIIIATRIPVQKKDS
ncbi:ExbD/TolR family protein [candidate division CSSED10-310 bacterium]|uniref:ExbD/TolR family protein n=1 Tax=candidate division CSSED10-310 bacterium TaxID=2855610 RepID=A0ABV6YR69_UNCC1